MAWPPSTHQDAQDAITALRTTGVTHSQVLTNGTDQTTVLQAEINSLTAAGGGTLILPAGVIMVSTVVMKHQVTLQGQGKQVTVLKAISGSAPTPGLVTMDTGPVFWWMRDLEVRGNGNSGQHGIYAQAVGAGVANNGGWWNSGLSQVIVRSFTGDQIWLRGGGSDFLKPHQFLTFIGVEAYTTNARVCLRMTGQVGQVTMINCEFDGPAQSNNGTNVSMGRHVDDTLVVDDSTSTYFVQAIGCTSQNNQRAVVMDNTAVIMWNGYFEAVSEAIATGATCEGILISNCIMGNTGVNGGAGFCVKSGSGCVVHVRDCHFGSPSDVHLLNSFGALLASGNTVGGGGQILTSGMTAQVSSSAGTLTTNSARSVLVNTSATAITTITSTLHTDETLSLKAWSGSIVLGSGGNIHASGRTLPLTIPANAVVTLVKYDLGAVWNIQSVSV